MRHMLLTLFKMMIDFYGDQDQIDTVKFGIYDCRESNNFLSQ